MGGRIPGIADSDMERGIPLGGDIGRGPRGRGPAMEPRGLRGAPGMGGRIPTLDEDMLRAGGGIPRGPFASGGRGPRGLAPIVGCIPTNHGSDVDRGMPD
jgi:hypothetical protein